MIKKEIYPKTKRLEINGGLVNITEKLDGSNLCIFKLNDVIYIAQRNTILVLDKIILDLNKQVLYKGLYQWLLDNKEVLEKELNERSVICGEFIGMGNIKYDVGDFDKRFYMFAKANITEEFELYNLKYDRELFIYPFVSQQIPNFIGIVPLVAQVNYLPTKDNLDVLYDKYSKKVNRDVEGFVVDYQNIIAKYVRMKRGKLKDHFDRKD